MSPKRHPFNIKVNIHIDRKKIIQQRRASKNDMPYVDHFVNIFFRV